MWLILLGALFACQAAPEMRLEKARLIAREARMREDDIPAAPFLIRAYERVDKPSVRTVRVYIEGDGLAWLGKSKPSPNPTPINPVALSLARADSYPNLIYLARPCQYNRMKDGAACPDDYWKAARFAPVVIDALNMALDDIKRRYAFQKVELIGFSGGAAVALLLAARRGDVVNLRTVAGVLDTEAFIRIHQVSPLAQSLNPAGVAGRIATIPQLHFTGSHDEIIPKGVYESFRHASGISPCIRQIEVADATHELGWAARWPKLLSEVPVCSQTIIGSGG